MNSSAPLVSVIVPAYNAAPYLVELCQSIEAQTYRHFEVLILDDGSTDGTPAAVEAFQKDPRFKLLRWQPNRGVNPATSELLSRMRGDFWSYPGADDLLEPAFLEQRVARLEASPAAVAVHGPAIYIDERGREIPPPGVSLDLPVRMEAGRALTVLLQHNVINTPSILVRTSVTRRVEPHFLTTGWRFAQDWYLWLLHLANGFDLLWDQRRLHRYRIHPQSLTQLPSREAARSTETRLVPLCALSCASRFSPLAAGLWARWRDDLYRLWLLRAGSLKRHGWLNAAALRQGAQAYYGAGSRRASLTCEWLWHGPGLVRSALGERAARAKQRFRVSGLARIDDPIFR